MGIKIFQRDINHNEYDGNMQVFDTFQFFIIKNMSFLSIIYSVDKPCPYTGMRIVTEFLSPNSLFGMDFEIKGYSLGFWLFTEYCND